MSFLNQISNNDPTLRADLAQCNCEHYFDFVRLALGLRSAIAVKGNKIEVAAIKADMRAQLIAHATRLTASLVPVKTLTDRIIAGDHDLIDFLVVESMTQIRLQLDASIPDDSDTDSAESNDQLSTGGYSPELRRRTIVGDIVCDTLCGQVTSRFFENFLILSPRSHARFVGRAHPGMFGMMFHSVCNESTTDRRKLVEHLRKVHSRMQIDNMERATFRAAFLVTLSEVTMTQRLKTRLVEELDFWLSAIFQKGAPRTAKPCVIS